MDALKEAMTSTENDELTLNLNSSSVDVDPIEDQTQVTSKFLCTPGCAHTGSFNSYCC